MRTFTLAVVLVLAVLLLAAGGVAAHGNDGNTTGHDDAPENGSAADWATWMEQHVTERTGADAAAQMREQMGMSSEEVGEHMAAHQNDSMMHDGMRGGTMDGGMPGMSCH